MHQLRGIIHLSPFPFSTPPPPFIFSLVWQKHVFLSRFWGELFRSPHLLDLIVFLVLHSFLSLTCSKAVKRIPFLILFLSHPARPSTFSISQHAAGDRSVRTALELFSNCGIIKEVLSEQSVDLLRELSQPTTRPLLHLSWRLWHTLLLTLNAARNHYLNL